MLAREFPDLEVLLVGNGIERGPVVELAAELGIGDRLDASGAVGVDDVSAVYQRASVVAVPSRYPEPFGLVAVEAGLARRPVVASAVGGLPEVVDHGVTGLLVAPDDPEALADALATVLRDRALATRFAHAGRARALDRFGMERHTSAYEHLLQECAARGPARLPNNR